MLDPGKADVWDSGRVEAAQSHLVPFGKPVGSGRRIHWKVRYWDQDGRPSPWSEPASFEMTMLKPEDWKAKWIEAPAVPVNNPVTECWGDFLLTKSEPVRLDSRRSPSSAAAVNSRFGGDGAGFLP